MIAEARPARALGAFLRGLKVCCCSCSNHLRGDALSSTFRHLPRAFQARCPAASTLLIAAFVAVIAGCAKPPSITVTPIKAATLDELQQYMLSHKPDLDQFRQRGPFAVEVRENQEVVLSPKERVTADLYLSVHKEKAPLVILMHGYDNSKADHAYQGMHVASWGVHTLAVQLPNRARWQGNGRSLASLVNTIRRQPELLDSRIDVDRIILAAHSFGGISVSIALAEGAPAMAGILLDPAGIGKELPAFLRKINKPLMVIGSDPQVSITRERDNFYRLARGGVTEVSIKGAVHEDGQFPMNSGLAGLMSDATEEMQITFVSALTSAAFSLAATGKFDYAWTSFRGSIESGKLVGAKRK
jgi:pimeloyl-ACP methyl ester carboxylesterase